MFKKKKSLGQNFLKSEKALNKIIEAGEVSEGDVVLEIGPGDGALTKKLLEKAGKVIAIEKDSRLIKILEETFAKEIKEGKFELINKDILDSDLVFLENKNYKLIANIPYYITGEIIQKFLSTSSNTQPQKIVLMVQKEVATRIVASDSKESILSMSVKVYGDPKYEMTVNKKYFSPSPKVDSAILSISNISKDKFTENDISEEDFFEILKEGFKHKRKRLFKNLNIKESEIPKDLDKSDKNIRAEELSLEDWMKLVKAIKYSKK